MRHAAHPLSAPIALDVPIARVAKELIRAALAYAVFLILLVPAGLIELDRLYAKPVLAVAQAIVVSTQHFPLLARVDNPALHNLDHVVILTCALFLVSTNLDLVSRLRRFGPALVAIFAYHVVVAVLTIKVQEAQELLTSMKILVLSPSEFHVVDWLRYFSYDLGLEIAPFVMLLLTVVWNLTASRARIVEPSRRGARRWAVAAIGMGIMAIFVLAAVLYGRLRETDPRHVEAHAKIGHLFWNSRKDAQAEEQYRLALAGGTTDPEVFYNLAGLEVRSGNRRAALPLLEQGMRMAHEPVWQSRFQKAIGLMQPKSASR